MCSTHQAYSCIMYTKLCIGHILVSGLISVYIALKLTLLTSIRVLLCCRHILASSLISVHTALKLTHLACAVHTRRTPVLCTSVWLCFRHILVSSLISVRTALSHFSGCHTFRGTSEFTLVSGHTPALNVQNSFPGRTSYASITCSSTVTLNWKKCPEIEEGQERYDFVLCIKLHVNLNHFIYITRLLLYTFSLIKLWCTDVR